MYNTFLIPTHKLLKYITTKYNIVLFIYIFWLVFFKTFIIRNVGILTIIITITFG